MDENGPRQWTEWTTQNGHETFGQRNKKNFALNFYVHLNFRAFCAPEPDVDQGVALISTVIVSLKHFMLLFVAESCMSIWCCPFSSIALVHLVHFYSGNDNGREENSGERNSPLLRLFAESRTIHRNPHRMDSIVNVDDSCSDC